MIDTKAKLEKIANDITALLKPLKKGLYCRDDEITFDNNGATFSIYAGHCSCCMDDWYMNIAASFDDLNSDNTAQILFDAFNRREESEKKAKEEKTAAEAARLKVIQENWDRAAYERLKVKFEGQA